MEHDMHSPWHVVGGECWDCVVEKLHANGDPHIKTIPPYVHILYGPGNGGKTYYVASSMWEPVEGKQLRKGRLVSFGREYNAALGVPDELQRLGSVDLRFKSPKLDNREWMETLHRALISLIDRAMKTPSDHLDVLAVDGLNELNWLAEQSFRNLQKNEKDKFAPFNRWDEDFFSLMQKLDPQVLGHPILMTARVAERRKEVKDLSSGKVVISEDDEEVLGAAEYLPRLRGGFKFWLANYAQILTYCRQESMLAPSGPYKGERVSVRKMSLGADGDWLTKFQWEGQWRRARLPLTLLDPTYDMFMAMLWRALGSPEPKASA